MGSIVVFLEQQHGKVKPVAREALGEGRRLLSAGFSAREVCAVLIGDAVASEAEELAERGESDRVCFLENPLLHFYSSERYARVLADLAGRLQASLILMGATALGKDLGPKVAAKLHAPCAQDCIAIQVDKDQSLVVVRPVYGGKLIARIRSVNDFLVATLRPTAFSASSPTGRKAVIESLPQPDWARAGRPAGRPAAEVKEVVSTAGSRVELTEARIIVSGGRGLREAANFSLIEELAETLGAAVGASRAAVDAGWKPHAYQVGLTGRTVSPLLYIACGISGAIQHQAGMSSAQIIVAINKDPQAPIFKIAHYGIVGDLFEIVPRLTAALRQTLHPETSG